MKTKKEMIKEINEKLIQCSDLKDEYQYWDEETTKKNFKAILTGYEAVLRGTKALLKKV